MSWLDEYRQASYKGVEFYVPDHSFTGGKRAKVWEYPGKNKPYVQKLGNKAERFTINGYLVDDNYTPQRNDLIDAVRADTNGKLVHPYYGEIIVDVLDWDFRESVREGAMVRFTLQCVESGELTFPLTTIDNPTAVANKKRSAYDAMIEAFDAAYDIVSVPHSIAQNAIATVNKGLEAVEKAKTVVSAVSEFRRDIDTLKGKGIALAYDAKALGNSVVESVQFGTNFTDDFPVTVENSRENFENMTNLFLFTPEQITSEDPFSPPNMIAELYQMTAAVSATTLLTVMQYDSYEASIEFRDIALKKLDFFMEKVTDDLLYMELYSLRAQVIKDLEERAQNLPRLSVTVLPVSLPALVLSQRLYQTVDNEQDIIDRNNIFNPAFVPALTDLEVLVYE